MLGGLLVHNSSSRLVYFLRWQWFVEATLATAGTIHWWAAYDQATFKSGPVALVAHCRRPVRATFMLRERIGRGMADDNSSTIL